MADTQSEPRPPVGLRAAGRRLWRAVADEFELAEAELALLGEAARVTDRLNELDRILRREGLIVPGAGDTTKAHPALAEARQQEVTLARLIVALRVPDASDDDDPGARAQRRAVRGVYQFPGSA